MCMGRKRIRILAIIFVMVCASVYGMYMVQKATYRSVLETQFCIAMHEANYRFEEYLKSGDRIDFLLGVSSIGIAAQMAPQFPETDRVFTEHSKLRQLYEGLFSVTSMKDSEIIQKLILTCSILEENSRDSVGYNFVQEIVLQLNNS